VIFFLKTEEDSGSEASLLNHEDNIFNIQQPVEHSFKVRSLLCKTAPPQLWGSFGHFFIALLTQAATGMSWPPHGQFFRVFAIFSKALSLMPPALGASAPLRRCHTSHSAV
jgi:hypothetical protein